MTYGSVTGGCYGVRVFGIQARPGQLLQAPESWPILHVTQSQAVPPWPEGLSTAGDGNGATWRNGLEGYRVLRKPGYSLQLFWPRELLPEELVHPHLSPGAAAVSRWEGRDALHGAVVAKGGRAMAVLAEREGGKSTTIAWLSRQPGWEILADDLVIFDEHQVFAGPRSIDLRPAGVDLLHLAAPLDVRESERARLRLPSCPLSLPLAGAVRLEWGDQFRVSRLSGVAALREVAAHRMVYIVPGRPEPVFELAARPVLRVERPPGVPSLERLTEVLGELTE